MRVKSRDALIAIFLADSYFRFSLEVWPADIYFFQIPIVFLRTIIDSIYKQKYMQTSNTNYLHNRINY